MHGRTLYILFQLILQVMTEFSITLVKESIIFYGKTIWISKTEQFMDILQQADVLVLNLHLIPTESMNVYSSYSLGK